jgi:hypothetical protein
MSDLLLKAPWGDMHPMRRNRFYFNFDDFLDLPSWIVQNAIFLDNNRIKMTINSYLESKDLVQLSNITNKIVELLLLNRTGESILKGRIMGFTIENIHPEILDYKSDEQIAFICEIKYEEIIWE